MLNSAGPEVSNGHFKCTIQATLIKKVFTMKIFAVFTTLLLFIIYLLIQMFLETQGRICKLVASLYWFLWDTPLVLQMTLQVT